MAQNGPTPYEDLNGILEHLVAGVREILGDDLCGVYLQGSFALGDADVHSDVDFIVVVDGEVSGRQEAELQALHRRLYALEVPWAQHLEGSYVPRDNLRRVDPARTPYLYLDNGATELTRDSHCNTAVVRATLRDHGVVLAGPDPTGLIEPVTAADLADDVRLALADWAQWLEDHELSRRGQGVLVTTLCRMLQTLAEGRVTSKREACTWALRTLGPEWTPLIRRAVDDRPDPWMKVREPADPEALEQTLAFLDYVRSEARQTAGAREP
jgi:predicted nucleotidyltransferase